jgi:hypothetical protein
MGCIYLSMGDYTYSGILLLFIIDLISITLIDTLGAIASRKLNFKYIYLSALSFLVYIVIGYLVSKPYSLTIALFINGILGLYDGTIGLYLSLTLKANNGMDDEQIQKVLGVNSAIVMIITSIPLTLIGYGLTHL